MLLLLREGCCLDYMLDCADVSLWESGEVSFKVNESCVVLAVAFEVGVLLLRRRALRPPSPSFLVVPVLRRRWKFRGLALVLFEVLVMCLQGGVL